MGDSDTLVEILGLTQRIDERTERHSETLRIHGDTLTEQGKTLARLDERSQSQRVRINNLDRRFWRYIVYGGGGVAGAGVAALAAWAKLGGG